MGNMTVNFDNYSKPRMIEDFSRYGIYNNPAVQNYKMQLKPQPAQDGFDYSKDDGYISFTDKMTNFGKGLISPVTAMFSSPEAFLTGAAMIAGGALLIAATGGAAAPVLAAAGLGIGAFQFGKGAYNAYNAKTDEEARQAWQGIGAGTVSIGLSAAGAKTALKTAGIETKDMGAVKASIECVKQTPKMIGKSFKAFSSGEYLTNLGLKSKPEPKVKPENKPAEADAEQKPKIKTEPKPEDKAIEHNAPEQPKPAEQPAAQQPAKKVNLEKTPEQMDAKTEHFRKKMEAKIQAEITKLHEQSSKITGRLEKLDKCGVDPLKAAGSLEQRIEYLSLQAEQQQIKIQILKKQGFYVDTDMIKQAEGLKNFAEALKLRKVTLEEILPKFKEEFAGRTSREMAAGLKNNPVYANADSKVIKMYIKDVRRSEIVRPSDKPFPHQKQNLLSNLSKNDQEAVGYYIDGSIGSNSNTASSGFLNEAFASVPTLEQDAIVYRSVNKGCIGLKVFTDADFQTGSIIKNPGITSASIGNTQGFDYYQLGSWCGADGYTMRIHLPKGTRYIDAGSEIMLPPNNQMKVTAFNPSTRVADVEYILPQK